MKIVVTRTVKSPLSPSWELLKAYKNGEVSWEEYEERFRKEIAGRPEALEHLRTIKELSKHKDVYLICYEKNPPCHRFILMKILGEIN